MASIQRRELRRERIAERKRMRRRRNHPAPDSAFQAQRVGVVREEESDDDEGEQTQVIVRNDIEDVVDGIAEHEREMERRVQEIFSQARKGQPKKTLFFVLPNREMETLSALIVENVLPGTTIFTDQFGSYNNLNALGYNHHTVCHKERFTRFSFDTQEGTALRITTNHIERMWVELRRECKSLGLDKARELILLEPYRERFLFHRSWVENVETVLRHFGEIGPEAI